MMGQFGHTHWEDDMVHNYAHGFSMSNHLGLPTTTILKGEPFAYIK
jgi:hypothetical protein